MLSFCISYNINNAQKTMAQTEDKPVCSIPTNGEDNGTEDNSLLEKCRICNANATDDVKLRPLFHGNRLSRLVYNITRIELKNSPGVPSLVCAKCVAKAARFSNFQVTLRRSEEAYNFSNNTKSSNKITNGDDDSILQKCRTCLNYVKEGNKLRPLFNGDSLRKLVYNVTNIQLKNWPDASSLICMDCIDILSNFLRFQLELRRTEEAFNLDVERQKYEQMDNLIKFANEVTLEINEKANAERSKSA